MSEDVADPNDNGAVHTVAKIIKAVMSSVAEAECRIRRAIPQRKNSGVNPNYFGGVGTQCNRQHPYKLTIQLHVV